MAIAIYEKKIVVTEASIDILGHVNNREYLRWMEEVAIEHSAALGWPQERYMAEQHVWVAREHWIEYLRPALLGDHLSVYTWLQETAGLSAAAPCSRAPRPSGRISTSKQSAP